MLSTCARTHTHARIHTCGPPIDGWVRIDSLTRQWNTGRHMSGICKCTEGKGRKSITAIKGNEGDIYRAAALHVTISVYRHPSERVSASTLVSTTSCGRLRDGATCSRAHCMYQHVRTCTHSRRRTCLLFMRREGKCVRRCECFLRTS